MKNSAKCDLIPKLTYPIDRIKQNDRRRAQTDRRSMSDRRDRKPGLTTANAPQPAIQQDRRARSGDRRTRPDRRVNMDDLITNFRMRYLNAQSWDDKQTHFKSGQ